MTNATPGPVEVTQAERLFDAILGNVSAYGEWGTPSYREAALREINAAFTRHRTEALVSQRALVEASDDELDPHLPESINAAKRCGMQRSAWLSGWFVPWSPRNDNENAEGPWSDWVALAHRILEADAKARAALAALKETDNG